MGQMMTYLTFHAPFFVQINSPENLELMGDPWQRHALHAIERVSGKARVHRGGGWSSAAKRCRSAARIGRSPSAYRGSYLGFRVVLK
jgi:formylglycine-generating enzyme required for sulfatase activity